MWSLKRFIIVILTRSTIAVCEATDKCIICTTEKLQEAKCKSHAYTWYLYSVFLLVLEFLIPGLWWLAEAETWSFLLHSKCIVLLMAFS